MSFKSWMHNLSTGGNQDYATGIKAIKIMLLFKILGYLFLLVALIVIAILSLRLFISNTYGI